MIFFLLIHYDLSHSLSLTFFFSIICLNFLDLKPKCSIYQLKIILSKKIINPSAFIPILHHRQNSLVPTIPEIFTRTVTPIRYFSCCIIRYHFQVPKFFIFQSTVLYLVNASFANRKYQRSPCQ